MEPERRPRAYQPWSRRQRSWWSWAGSLSCLVDGVYW